MPLPLASAAHTLKIARLLFTLSFLLYLPLMLFYENKSVWKET